MGMTREDAVAKAYCTNQIAAWRAQARAAMKAMQEFDAE